MDKIWIVWYLDEDDTEVVIIPCSDQNVASDCYNDISRSHRYAGLDLTEVRHVWKTKR